MCLVDANDLDSMDYLPVSFKSFESIHYVVQTLVHFSFPLILKGKWEIK